MGRRYTIALQMDIRERAAPLLRAPWFGYLFGLVVVLLATAMLAALLSGRVANSSALYTIPVLLTAALYGRGPALWTSLAAFVAFDWFFVDAPSRLDPQHWPTLFVFLITALVAGQLAVALRQQAQEARRREQEAVALYEVARLVPGSTLDLEPLLGELLDQLKTIVGYDATAVMLRDERSSPVIVEYRGPLPRERVVGNQLHPDSAIGHLLESVSSRREPIIVQDVPRGALVRDLVAVGVALPPDIPDSQTELAVPLIVKGRVIGMQVVLRPAANRYTPRDAELALIFAQHAAVAIENARLYGEARNRLNEIVGLQQLGATLLEEHDSDRLLREILLQLQSLTNAEGVALGFLDQHAREFELRAVVGPGADVLLGTRVAADGSFAGEAVRTNEALRSDDAKHDPRGYIAGLPRGDVRTILAVPMRTRQQVMGAISIYNKRLGAVFTDRDAELAMLFAQQAAVAIENARLYEEARGKAALEERQRLARELHDSVSQALYGISLNVSSAQELLDVAPDRTHRLLGDVLRLAEAGLTEMRALIFELRPESLEQEGLVGALEKQAAAAEARHGLNVRLNVPDEPGLPLEAKEALYRVAQEALHNAARHARARSVDIALQVADGRVRLVVADDGRGFDPDQGYPGHLGLRSMRERVTALGGTLEIDSRPGGPTRVTALLAV